MTDNQDLKRLEEIHIPVIRSLIGLGWVEALESLIPVYRNVAVRHARQDLIAIFDGFGQWLGEARTYEAIHGAGSLFKHDHPDMVAAEARRDAFLAKEERRKSGVGGAVVQKEALAS